MSREEDKRVAEILGWTFWKESRGENLIDLVVRPGKEPWTGVKENNKERYRKIKASEFSFKNCINADVLPKFTSDPTADYQVLEWMRRNLTGGQKDWVGGWLYDVRDARYGTFGGDFDYPKWMNYKPGDYSLALLELDKKGLLK